MGCLRDGGFIGFSFAFSLFPPSGTLVIGHFCRGGVRVRWLGRPAGTVHSPVRPWAVGAARTTVRISPPSSQMREAPTRGRVHDLPAVPVGILASNFYFVRSSCGLAIESPVWKLLQWMMGFPAFLGSGSSGTPLGGSGEGFSGTQASARVGAMCAVLPGCWLGVLCGAVAPQVPVQRRPRGFLPSLPLGRRRPSVSWFSPSLLSWSPCSFPLPSHPQSSSPPHRLSGQCPDLLCGGGCAEVLAGVGVGGSVDIHRVGDGLATAPVGHVVATSPLGRRRSATARFSQPPLPRSPCSPTLPPRPRSPSLPRCLSARCLGSLSGGGAWAVARCRYGG